MSQCPAKQESSDGLPWCPSLSVSLPGKYLMTACNTTDSGPLMRE